MAADESSNSARAIYTTAKPGRNHRLRCEAKGARPKRNVQPRVRTAAAVRKRRSRLASANRGRLAGASFTNVVSNTAARQRPTTAPAEAKGTAAAGPYALPDGPFALPRGSAGMREVRDVCASDQQDETHRSEENQSGLSRVAERAAMQAQHAERDFVSKLRRKGREGPGEQRLQLDMSLRRGLDRVQSGEGGSEEHSAALLLGLTDLHPLEEIERLGWPRSGTATRDGR